MKRLAAKQPDAGVPVALHGHPEAAVLAIAAAEGRIMIGSSTELNNEVPLANFLALREAVFENSY